MFERCILPVVGQFRLTDSVVQMSDFEVGEGRMWSRGRGLSALYRAGTGGKTVEVRLDSTCVDVCQMWLQPRSMRVLTATREVVVLILYFAGQARPRFEDAAAAADSGCGAIQNRSPQRLPRSPAHPLPMRSCLRLDTCERRG